MSSVIGSSTAAFYANLPSGYVAAASSSSTTGSTAPADIVDIRVPLPAATFTARARDSLSVRELFGSPDADMMRVALRGESGGRDRRLSRHGQHGAERSVG
ncbi:hypothetical protein [Roseomonas sp. WA12]